MRLESRREEILESEKMNFSSENGNILFPSLFHEKEKFQRKKKEKKFFF